MSFCPPVSSHSLVRPLAEPFFRPKAGEGGLLRTGAEAVLQLLMDADVEGMIGYEHSGERTIWRNGHRNRVLDTRLGSLQLRIPKLRQGSYFPPFLGCPKIRRSAFLARYATRRPSISL
jgi:putative transposase